MANRPEGSSRISVVARRLLRESNLLDRNRFAAIDPRMSPDRLQLPDALAALLSRRPARAR